MEKIDHIALVVSNVSKAVRWYESNRDCKIKYQDDTWALLEFDNIDLALVSASEHPPHIAFVDNSIKSCSKKKFANITPKRQPSI